MKKEKKTVITRNEIAGIQELLASSDKENEQVALTILDQCSHLESLPWLIILYREMDITLQINLTNKAKKLDKFLNKHIETGKPLSIQDSWFILHKLANSEDAIKYMIEESFSAVISKQLIGWGFTFMNNYKITIKPKNDNTEPE